MSLQVAILKVLASHGSGRATFASLKRDVVVLAASGAEWNARIRRLASRVPAIDIFGSRYVLRDGEGWQITAAGRNFLDALEALTQDNQPPVPKSYPSDVSDTAAHPQGRLIVIGARFRNRISRRRNAVLRNARAFPDQADVRPRGESTSR